MKSSRRLRIWLLKAGEPLPLQTKERLMRTGLLAKELVRRGHEVTWWTSAWDHRNKKWIESGELTVLPDGLRLFLLRGCGYTRNISLKRMIDHRRLARRFSELAIDQEKPDLILSSYPPYDSAAAAVRFASARHIPVIVDLRDEWPDLFLEKLPSFLRPFSKWLLSSEFSLAKEAIQGATALTSMMQDMLNWGLAHAKRAARGTDRVFYLGAEPTINSTQTSLANSVREIQDKVQNKLVATYVGTFGHYSDPTYLVDAAKALPEVHFVFAGQGPKLGRMRQLAEGLPNVHFPGWLTGSEMSGLLRISHFGICPNSTPRNGFPNKIMSFLADGLPVLCYYQGQDANQIESFNIGACFPAGDTERTIMFLKKMRPDSPEYLAMRARAEKCFKEKFNAEKIYGDFADYLERMAISPNQFAEREVEL